MTQSSPANDMPLWTPSQERIDASRMRAFADFCSARSGMMYPDFKSLHAWSVSHCEDFWSAVWDFGGVVGDKGERIVVDAEKMPGAQFFPDSAVNYAENLLRRTGDDPAIIFRGEDKARSSLSWNALRELVSRLQQAFLALGIKEGDRIAAMVPNLPETIACMMAANSIGAIWSSCSPDFGEQGVMDRFGQIEPVLFIACGHWRAFAVAALGSVTLWGGSLLVLGPNTWGAFFSSLSAVSGAVSAGEMPLYKMVNVYAAIRLVWMPEPIAIGVAGLALLAALVGVFWTARQTEDPRWHYAVVASANLIAAPYSMYYELILLTFSGASCTHFFSSGSKKKRDTFC